MAKSDHPTNISPVLDRPGLERQVRQQLKVLTGREPYLGPPKTTTSRRTVELPEAAGLPLARHLELVEPAEVLVIDETDPRSPRTRPARLVFTNARGEPAHRASWSHVWAPAVRAAGLPAGFGLHGLRHYYATRSSTPARRSRRCSWPSATRPRW